ncbi:MAG: CPBP family intramembrane metalloprotease [Gemmatimonadales bacterium]|jgi:membrane protease YdiL (CAAX protease family)
MLFAWSYFCLYLALQFAVGPEGEGRHWLTLVAIPLLGIAGLARWTGGAAGLGTALRGVGLSRDTWTVGLRWAVPLGLGLSALQLVLSRNSAEFLALVTSTRVLWVAPVTLVFLLLAAASTEEFFFRGILQRKTEAWLGGGGAPVGRGAVFLSLLAASLAFAVYHLPYAYLSPNWPSHGDVGLAVQYAMVDGMLGGLVTGGVFIGARGNLIAPILVHALIDLFPAMTMIRFGGPGA